MFLHQGQQNMKELRFHPYYREMLVTTAEDSFNIFRPNLDPEEDELAADASDNLNDEESKVSDTTAASHQASSQMKAGQNLYVNSDEEEEEENRMVKVARKLNKQRSDAKEKRARDGKRRRTEQ